MREKSCGQAKSDPDDRVNQGGEAVRGDGDAKSYECVVPNLAPEETRCFAADFYRQQQRPKLAEFMEINLVGIETQDCHLVADFPAEIGPDALYKKFGAKLREQTEVFAYGVSPKSYSQHVSTAGEIRNAYQMAASAGATEQTIEASLNRNDSLNAVLAHPIVVGFGSPQSSIPSLSMSFGWMIAPQLNTLGAPKRIDGQYDLAAVISVPSWWRSVDLQVETCWLPRSRLSDFKPELGSSICEGKKIIPPPRATVRLPGGAQEVSRKLGIELLQEPNLVEGPSDQILEIGKPGSLLLMGGRLWRSSAGNGVGKRSSGKVFNLSAICDRGKS